MDISSMLEVEVQEVADSKENVTPIQKPQPNFPCKNFSKEETEFYKLTYGSDVASVRFFRLHCTGCDEHIGSAPAESHNMHEHPVLRTLLCAKCREFYGDGTFEQGEDATDMFCRWCANGGNLYCCSYCSNTFCSKCIKRNFDPMTIKKIEAEDSWKCFVCDPKPLFHLRSITRALLIHIETVTRILENDRRMSPKDIEEKMHLDETKCCSRKRKRRRRRTLSNSDDDEEEDVNYVPEIERPETPPVKKRKSRSKDSTQRNLSNAMNGYDDHEYSNCSSKRRTAKVESDLDPSDLICEQTMIEGESEIVRAKVQNVTKTVGPTNDTNSSPKTSHPIVNVGRTEPRQQSSPQHQPGQTSMSNNARVINPVPLANLLKVALSSGAKKIKVSHSGGQKVYAVPLSTMSKLSSASNSFAKAPTHFLVPNNSAHRQARLAPQKQQPSVIDLDSDDEPVILDGNSKAQKKGKSLSAEQLICDEVIDASENVVTEPMQMTELHNEAIVPSMTELPRAQTTQNNKDSSNLTIDAVIPLKTQQREQRFKKMLLLQSQEIDSTLNELKTKILKLMQISNSKQHLEADPLGSAAVCTKRFHRALRKTLVELSHINDRVVRDFVHWKKKTCKADAERTLQEEKDSDIEVVEPEKKTMESISNTRDRSNQSNDDPTLEMICVRDSASEASDDEDNALIDKDHVLESTNLPTEFAQILDHLSIFKRKPTAIKAVGDSSVLTEDKACQAYDVSWRDYEKCIGYSLLTKTEYDPETRKDLNRPVVEPDENFGKYQEQYLFYLQHIEDFGIETDELKGLPDPNHIPLKDLIDGTSPFIMDMLERLSPVTLSNGCSSPPSPPPANASDGSALQPSSPALAMMDVESITHEKSNPEMEVIMTTTTSSITDEPQETENVAATSKAVEELVKMVTKLSEDIRSEKKDLDDSDVDKETAPIVNTFLDAAAKDSDDNQAMDNEIADFCATSSNDECKILD